MRFDLLPLQWPRSGTICCSCFGLEMVPQQKVRFVAVALASKWCPSAEKYLLPLLWPRSEILVLKSTIAAAVALASSPSAKKYDLLQL